MSRAETVFWVSLVLIAAVWWLVWQAPAPRPPPASVASPHEVEGIIRRGCAQCHAFPPPTLLPKRLWAEKVKLMYQLTTRELMTTSGPPLPGVTERQVARWYEAHAPDTLPVTPRQTRPDPGPLKFRRRTVAVPGGTSAGIANVRRITLLPGGARKLATSNMVSGEVHLLTTGTLAPALVGQFGHPSHVEAADLDLDGRSDLLVSDLGFLSPTDEPCGRVLAVLARDAGRFETRVILDKVGRVADARAIDFDGDGDMDVAVAAFGWRKIGSTVVLENLVRPSGKLEFKPHVVDPRSGGVSLVAGQDLDEDGRPDFVALISQQHEAALGFLYRGFDQFEELPIHRAPHPDWGYTNVDSADLDGDGDLDLVLSHGDTLDSEVPFKPGHGIQWLENLRGGRWRSHDVGRLYGVFRTEPGDLDGDGDMDLVSSTFLPQAPGAPEAKGIRVESVVWWENAKGSWIPWSIEAGHSHHPTLALMDVDADGDLDVVVGTLLFTPDPKEAALEVFENLGRP